MRMVKDRVIFPFLKMMLPGRSRKVRGNKLRVTFDRLISDLRGLGISDGDHVLTHASLSRIGYVPDGPRTVIEAILATVGPNGTALFPALTSDPEISPEQPPVFDVRISRTQGIGVIPESARGYPGAARSLQPTHSVTAIGGLAQWFVEGHERCETPCGAGSPYDKLRQVDGKILLLGCDHQANTTMHLVEEMIGVPYHLLPGVAIATVTRADGYRHHLPVRLHRWGVPRDFMRTDAEMSRRGIQRVGLIGSAESRLVNVRAMCEILFTRLREDPYLLLPVDYHLPREFDYALHGRSLQ